MTLSKERQTGASMRGIVRIDSCGTDRLLPPGTVAKAGTGRTVVRPIRAALDLAVRGQQVTEMGSLTK
jgi:hypothetical protein